MSEAEDFEWDEICAKIAYEEEKLLKVHGSHEASSTSHTTKAGRETVTGCPPVQPCPETFERFSSEVEQSSLFDKDPSVNSSKLWKDRSQNTSWTQHPVTATRDLESTLIKKQGEISILRQRLERLEKEKFEAVEAYRVLRQDIQKRDSFVSNSSREEMNQLETEIVRLRKLNEFYQQEISSLEASRREKPPSRVESGKKSLQSSLDAEGIWKSPRKITRGQVGELPNSTLRGKNVLEEFDTVVSELNQHEQGRPRLNGLSIREKEQCGKLSTEEVASGKHYSRQTAVSFHIPPGENHDISVDVMRDCFGENSINCMNFFSFDDLISLRRLLLSCEKQLASSFLSFLKDYSVGEVDFLQNSIPRLHKFIDYLLQILESDSSVASLEDASRIFYSIFLKNMKFCRIWDIFSFVPLERVLAIVKRIMKETIPAKACFNIIEGTLVILDEFSSLQRVSEEDIENMVDSLKHLLTAEHEEILLSGHSLLYNFLKLSIDILASGQEHMKMKRSLYSDTIFGLMMSFLSSSYSCFQHNGVYLSYKLKEFFAVSLETDHYISLIEIVLCTMIREYLTETDTSFSERRERGSQRKVFGTLKGNGNAVKPESILCLHYSLRTCHFMIHELKQRNCSLDFLRSFSVPLLSVLKALLEDPHQAFGNLTEAYEMWSVACIVFKGGELNGDIQ